METPNEHNTELNTPQNNPNSPKPNLSSPPPNSPNKSSNEITPSNHDSPQPSPTKQTHNLSPSAKKRKRKQTAKAKELETQKKGKPKTTPPTTDMGKKDKNKSSKDNTSDDTQMIEANDTPDPFDSISPTDDNPINTRPIYKYFDITVQLDETQKIQAKTPFLSFMGEGDKHAHDSTNKANLIMGKN
jgi:hypothetical protein